VRMESTTFPPWRRAAVGPRQGTDARWPDCVRILSHDSDEMTGYVA